MVSIFVNKVSRWVSLLVLLTAFQFTPALAERAGTPLSLKVLTYNTHGLPSIFAGDKPQQRFPKIAALTEQYDLALLQEDFAHHYVLSRNLIKPTTVKRGMRSDMPPCLICAGSGLTLASNLSWQDWTLAAQFEPFETCSGLLLGLNDCLSQKGFQLLRFDHMGGDRLVVVNTHLDAGHDVSDREARKAQLDQIASLLEQEAAGQALIIAGDLNLDWQTPEDRAVLIDFRDRLGLTIAVDGRQADPRWEHLDYILFRSGDAVRLEVVETGEDQQFQDDAGPLSDHPALYVNFRIW